MAKNSGCGDHRNRDLPTVHISRITSGRKEARAPTRSPSGECRTKERGRVPRTTRSVVNPADLHADRSVPTSKSVGTQGRVGGRVPTGKGRDEGRGERVRQPPDERDPPAARQARRRRAGEARKGRPCQGRAQPRQRRGCGRQRGRPSPSGTHVPRGSSVAARLPACGGKRRA